MTHQINRVAVLGAGTMGAAIAAHCANAGLEVDLLDIAPDELTDEEEEKGLTLESPEVRNRIVWHGFEQMKSARPPALMSHSVLQRISIGNFEDDLERIKHADWILEAIVEKLEPKRDLFARVEELAKDGAIISSNTSGIPLHQIAGDRSESFKKRFIGTHFFNPPRYLKLLEVIPTSETDSGVLEEVRALGERVLGKGVVIAKDTPNFIGNRLGSFSMMNSMRYAFDNGYSIEEVDAVTGPAIGRPKTATFRLQDQVGLDISIGVAENLYDLVPEDESRESLRPPEKLQEMQEQNLIGLKAGAGFYKREERDGEKVFDVLNPETMEHEPPENPDVPLLEEAWEKGDLGTRLRFVVFEADEGDRHARFLRNTILPDLAYAARRVPEISDTLEDVDHAMEWGFGHEAGPFRMWDLLGVSETAERMEEQGLEVAGWVRQMLEDGNESFYKQDGTREELQMSPVTGEYEPVREDPMHLSLDKIRAEGGEISSNDAASLLDLGDGVLCFEVHTKGNSMNADAVEMGNEALRRLEEEDEWLALVIGNEGKNFCVGADLNEIAESARQVQQGETDGAASSVDAFQGLLMGLRFAKKPVVAAPHGQTIGGGTELCLHSDRVVAAGETYMGLVETGVGLIPAGGGTKELARRLISPSMHVHAPALPFVQEAFNKIAQAQVSGSALEAGEMGFLREEDRVVTNADHLLSAAKREALELADGYAPPTRSPESVFAAGATTRAALIVDIKTMEWGRYATEYDGVIGDHLARVLTGGDLTMPQWVPEEYMLELEKQAFLELLKNDETTERIEAMLENGKPLRN